MILELKQLANRLWQATYEDTIVMAPTIREAVSLVLRTNRVKTGRDAQLTKIKVRVD